MRVELLDKTHNKKEFECGKALLDEYLKHQAGQDVKRKLTACFVLKDEQSDLLMGYFTLSNSGIPLHEIPKNLRKKLPTSYTSLPVTLLGRLAVDNRFRGKGIGQFLLIDALKKSFETSVKIGSFAVVVDPIDDKATRFYQKYGFIKLPDSGKMFIAMKTIEQLLGMK